MAEEVAEPGVDSIVFDLDKTLIYTSPRPVSELYASGIMEDPVFLPARGRIYYFTLPDRPSEVTGRPTEDVSGMWGVIRPGAREFLRFCFRRFRRVIVFTAGTYEYAVAICDVLFRGIGKPYFIWARGDCTRVAERAVDVDRRLFELGYYRFRAVDDESVEMEAMNAKSLRDVAAAVTDLEGGDPVDHRQFMLVEDNYHSFITLDPYGAFFVRPFQSRRKSEVSNIPGTPGYSPDREAGAGGEDGDGDGGEDDDDDEGVVDGGEEVQRGWVDRPTTVFPARPIRRKGKYHWILAEDTTLDRLREFIEDHPDYSSRQYCLGWNAIYGA